MHLLSTYYVPWHAQSSGDISVNETKVSIIEEFKFQTKQLFLNLQALKENILGLQHSVPFIPDTILGLFPWRKETLINPSNPLALRPSLNLSPF